MTNFYRKIRQKLAEENKFQRYMRYAVGEVLLIVLGIFFALQLQNWNENRKKEKQFKTAIEQLYNSIKYDVEILRLEKERIGNQKLHIDTLLNNPESISDYNLPKLLYWLTYEALDDYNSETNYHLSKLAFNPDNLEQNELAKQITNYTNSLNQKVEFENEALWEFLKENEIPYRGPEVNYEAQLSDIVPDSLYYNKNELDNLKAALNSHQLRTILKSLKGEKNLMQVFAYNRYDDAVSILQLIKSYYPDVRLLYQDVGILGTAIEGFINVKSKPLTLTNFDKSIWEIEIYLKDGFVKFRCRDSWNENWGGVDFPKGLAEHNGPNIPVKEGLYRVTLNLSENSYEFIKKEEK